MQVLNIDKLLHPWKPGPQKTYIFKNAKVVDPTDGSIELCTVRTARGIIESVTPADRAASGEPQTSSKANINTVILDLEGRYYITPGLIDHHVHLISVPGGNGLNESWKVTPDQSKLRQPYVCEQILGRGFTTVRDCGGASLALKEAIAEGVFPGPRIFMAGKALSQTGGHADLRSAHESSGTSCCGGGSGLQLGVLCDGVPECIKNAREQLRSGSDFLKIMAGGGVASPTDALTNVQFTAEEIKAITTVAANNKTFVTAHAYTVESIRQAIDNGVKGIEHGNMLDEETAALMAEKEVFLTPTLIAYSEMANPRWGGFLPPENASKNEAVLRAGLKSLQIASKAGVTMCYGSDLLGPLGIAQTKEFALRSQVLSSLAILQSATVNPARWLRQNDKLGQIKGGFTADLLILTRNPLEDVTVFDSPETNLLAVMKDGRVQVSRWSRLPQDVFVPLSVIE